jgi:hypothetical protein
LAVSDLIVLRDAKREFMQKATLRRIDL